MRRRSFLQSSLCCGVTLTRRLENLSTSFFSSAAVAFFKSASALARFSLRFSSYLEQKIPPEFRVEDMCITAQK